MVDILYCSVYILLFTFIILRSGFFKLPGFTSVHTLFAFYLKLLFGVVLWYIYFHHYKNRLSSDIFKYYDDAKILYGSIHNSFSDFIKMLTGIGDSSPAVQTYYKQMNNWANAYQSTFYNNSHLIIRLNALFMFFSQGHYGVHVIFMCFISLAGLVYLYKAFYPYLTDRYVGLFTAIFLFPSVLLWGSGILKEGIIFLGMGLSIYFFEKFLHKQGNTLKNILLTALGLILVFESKAYVLLCILPCFISEYAIKKISFSGKHPGITYLIITALYLGIGFNAGLISKKHNPLEMLAAKQLDFNRIARGGLYLKAKEDSNTYAHLEVEDSANLVPTGIYSDSVLHKHGIQYLASAAITNKELSTQNFAYYKLIPGTTYTRIRLHKDTLRLISNDSILYWVDIYNEPAKSRIEIAPIQPTITSLISHIPQALSISVLRPMPSEIHSSMVLIYFVENLFTLLLIMFAFAFIKRETLKRPMVAFCFTYSMLMLILIGLVTPLYGGIERYKCVVMPFLLILLLLIYDREKLNRVLKRTKKSE